MSCGIAIDAMGGDHAPREVVRGAVAAARSMDGVVLSLVGDPASIERELEEAGWKGGGIRVVEARAVIAMADNPVEALRRKRGSSIEEAVRLLRRGEAAAVVSAGNTGACVAAATLLLGLLPQVRRAGIAVALYAGEHPVVIIDVGANVAARPEHLIQYGVMASLYAREILGIENPRVGLLNIGEEDAKGTQLVKVTHQLFQDMPLNFAGNIEGVEIFRGACDVVVCDGFTGNIVLKVAEGLAERLIQLFRETLGQVSSDLRARLTTSGDQAALEQGYAASLARIEEKLDYSEYGGAPLLGVDGVVIIGHGRSEAKAIANAIRAARRMAERDINRHITERLGMDSKQAG